jgi:Fibronectin type III domain
MPLVLSRSAVNTRRVAVAVVSLVLPLAAAAVPARAAAAPSAGAPYIAVSHQQLVTAKVKAKGALSFAVLGVGGVPASGVSGVVLSVSVTAPAVSGALVAYPAGTKRPGVVSVSLTKGHASASDVVVVPGVGGRVTVFNASKASQRGGATAVAYYTAPGTVKATNATAGFVPVTPKRLGSVAVKAAGSVGLTALGKVGVPRSGVAGVVVALTVVGPVKSGALVAFPFGTKAPKQGSMSFHAGRSVTAPVIVKPGSSGRIELTNRSAEAVRVYADVVGYLQLLRVPSAPQSVTATARDGSAAVSWTAPSDDGGTPVTSYRVATEPGGVTVSVTATSAVIGGLSNGISYAFVVTAVNSRGPGPASAPSPAVTPIPPPSAPTNLAAVPTGIGQVTVGWTASDSLGPLSGYQLTAAPGGVTVTTTATSAVVGGLTSGQVYSFTAVARNAVGPSLVSAASNQVIAEGTSLTSVSTAGAPGDAQSADPVVSADGRYVAFDSSARNLVPQQTFGENAFVRDRLTDTTTLVSVNAGGTAGGNAGGTDPSISADGRYVAFDSTSSDLVQGGTDGTQDVFVRDLQTGITRLVSGSAAKPANGQSFGIKISGDGTTVVFVSTAKNLLANGTTAGENVFVTNLVSGITTLITVSSGSTGPDSGVNDPVISADGHYVAYDSRAGNLVAFPPANGHSQVFVADARLGGARMVTATGPTTSGNNESFVTAISDDGRYVVFYSDATDLVVGSSAFDNVFLGDTTNDSLALVTSDLGGTPSDASSFADTISADNRYLVVETDAVGMVAGDTAISTKVVRFDLQTGARRLVSANNAGVAADNDSNGASMSADGEHIVFHTRSTNLVTTSIGGLADVFAADLG